MNTQVKYLEILEQIKSHKNGDVSISMAQMGIIYGVNYGVSVPELKAIAEAFKYDHELALLLFEQDIRECKILATLVDDPKEVTGEQMDLWSQSFVNHEIVEQVSGNLFWKTECALSRSIEWCLCSDELMQKAGMIIAARKATDMEVKDSVFDPYIEIIDNFEDKQMSQNKVAVAYLLRQIALRNENFKSKVSALAQRMSDSNDENRAWVGSNLLYELEEVED
ncbi:MAG TPA: DNA alkylation repair protein [Tenuifilaceae bacterium]|nr:DNA alkylation repair protein [Tenuifilaceae bacterium]HPE18776.1 DNA alkylation repair protein [Tenuifilaceae bacterium]HPJ46066.1 DNA alkylation repair protein [Tenuifilaceae bacterium]HPQ34236.1 DNA alkylation repair protein [Tenuifilaceae bacterium]HRX68830.1 DNA alkylation repair protein [Tenuifilaceae bacterium]